VLALGRAARTAKDQRCSTSGAGHTRTAGATDRGARLPHGPAAPTTTLNESSSGSMAYSGAVTLPGDGGETVQTWLLVESDVFPAITTTSAAHPLEDRPRLVCRHRLHHAVSWPGCRTAARYAREWCRVPRCDRSPVGRSRDFPSRVTCLLGLARALLRRSLHAASIALTDAAENGRPRSLRKPALRARPRSPATTSCRPSADAAAIALPLPPVRDCARRGSCGPHTYPYHDACVREHRAAWRKSSPCRARRSRRAPGAPAWRCACHR
jgi:hypothetical protein